MPMYIYTVRVQLHKDRAKDAYDTLHKEMKEKGFRRTITQGGTKYHLPFGEYMIESDLPLERIVADAESAAKNASPLAPSIIVTKSDGQLGISGLKPLSFSELLQEALYSAA